MHGFNYTSQQSSSVVFPVSRGKWKLGFSNILKITQLVNKDTEIQTLGQVTSELILLALKCPLCFRLAHASLNNLLSLPFQFHMTPKTNSSDPLLSSSALASSYL